MPADADRYEAYYAEKLWDLLPEVYRAMDSDEPAAAGPLRELVARIGAQAAILRRGMDRLWEDQSIETCDDWVIPYIGDLLATRLVASLDARGKRLDVARTIYYRRRKGTRSILEQIASDITGWDVRVVEMFRRMARARHGVDPEIGWPEDAPAPDLARKLQSAQGLVGPRSGTPMGGTADLRSDHGASRTGSAFDEYFYTADVRRGVGRTGWHNIPRLAVFAYRLLSMPADRVTPVQDATCPNQYTFDPSGRDIPLFAASSRTYGDEWVSPAEHQVPGPIDAHLLRAELDQLYGEIAGSALVPRSLRVYEDDAAFALVPAASVTADPLDASKRLFIAPERGRVYVLDDSLAGMHVGYHHGFSSTLGAGTYDRRERGKPPVALPAPVTAVPLGGDLGAALTAAGSTGTVVLGDSLTYTTIADVTVDDLAVRADNRRRPVVRIAPVSAWTITGNPGSKLLIEGLWLCGPDIVLEGDFDEVVFRCCTLDPGEATPTGSGYAQAADGQALLPSRLRIEAAVREITIERSIVGPVQTEPGGSVERLVVRDSIVQAPKLADGVVPALSIGAGLTELERVTVLGPAQVHRLEASTCILHDTVTVTDNQHGCVRFSAYSEDSVLPKQYECVKLAPRTPIFVSRRFGDPGYAQLHATAGSALLEGAEDGSEMGAFHRERAAIKERSLLIKLQEYMPIGLSPVVVHVT